MKHLSVKAVTTLNGRLHQTFLGSRFIGKSETAMNRAFKIIMNSPVTPLADRAMIPSKIFHIEDWSLLSDGQKESYMKHGCYVYKTWNYSLRSVLLGKSETPSFQLS